ALQPGAIGRGRGVARGSTCVRTSSKKAMTAQDLGRLRSGSGPTRTSRDVRFHAAAGGENGQRAVAPFHFMNTRLTNGAVRKLTGASAVHPAAHCGTGGAA